MIVKFATPGEEKPFSFWIHPFVPHERRRSPALHIDTLLFVLTIQYIVILMGVLGGGAFPPPSPPTPPTAWL